MFSKAKLILLGTLFTLALSIQTSNVYASTKTEVDVDKLYLSESSPAERSEFINSRLNSGDDNVTITTVNEFDLCKSIDKSRGILPNQDGSQTKAYLERIQELSTKDKSELANMGFSDVRIQAIQSAQNSSFNSKKLNSTVDSITSLIATSAGTTCNLYMILDGYFYDHSFNGSKYKTLAYVTTGWNWSGMPLWTYDDGFATAWSSSTNLQLCQTSSAAEYYATNTNTYKYEDSYSKQAWNNRPVGLNGTSFEFQLGKSSGYNIYEYAKSGYSMNALMSTDFYVGSFTNSILYAHAYTTVSPSFSISGEGKIDAGWSFEKVSETFPRTTLFEKR
ncbi:MAG: hypothetical protein RSD22_06345 [Romboutsia sp.]